MSTTTTTFETAPSSTQGGDVLFDAFGLHQEPSTTTAVTATDFSYNSNMNSSVHRALNVTNTFDPFGLQQEEEDEYYFEDDEDDYDSLASPYPPPKVTRVSTRQFVPSPPESVAGLSSSRQTKKIQQRPQQKEQAPPVAKVPTTPRALPPRLVIKFHVHEDVSSVAKAGVENEGASEVVVEGSLHAQVQSSDANKHAPFVLMTSQSQQMQFRTTDKYVYNSPTPKPLPIHGLQFIHVPKSKRPDPVRIGTFALSQQVRHMPLLVERKVTVYNLAVRVAVQVRSKLSNNGDMKDFTISMAIPDRVDGDTVTILRGNGKYDALKRTIQWSVPFLPKGESFMVSAQAELVAPVPLVNRSSRQLMADESTNTRTTSAMTDDDSKMLLMPPFPVLLRCYSEHDQISSLDFGAFEADDHPATVSYSQTHSFRLLHRLH